MTFQGEVLFRISITSTIMIKIKEKTIKTSIFHYALIFLFLIEKINHQIDVQCYHIHSSNGLSFKNSVIISRANKKETKTIQLHYLKVKKSIIFLIAS